MTILGCAVDMQFDGCYAGNDSRFSNVCLWSNRAGAGWGSSCGSSTLPGVLILSLTSTDRWDSWLWTPIIALRLYLPLLFSSDAHHPLSSCVHTRRHSLFKVWEEIEKLPLLVLCLVGLLLAGLSPAPQTKQSMQGTAATSDQSNTVKVLVPSKRHMMSCSGKLDTVGSPLETMCFPLAANSYVSMCITSVYFYFM